ncbi:MAG: hypothetical protein EA397_07090 [Deltaproteobacteria bacterium]|nr:MAG: hypothetical protein EA397_07090 [Deltaproteobacteria bacterium]
MLPLLLSLAFAAPQPAGEPVDDAVGVQITEQGLGALSAPITSAVPVEPVPLPPTSDAAGWGCVNYAFELRDAVAHVEIVDARLRPRTGRLEVQVDLLVALNDTADRFILETELFCSEQTCPGYVEPFPVRATAPVELSVVSRGLEGRRIQVEVGEPDIAADLKSEDVHLDCNLGNVETVLDAMGLSLVEILARQAESRLAGELEDQLEDIQTQIEGALEALVTDQELDVGGVPVRIWTEPSSVEVEPGGLGLGLMLGASTEQVGSCVALYDLDHFQAHASAIPSITEVASSDVGVLLGDSAVHAILHAAWKGGLLCQVIDEGADLGITLNTSLLGALGGEPFRELFPQNLPLRIETDPRQHPTVAYEEDTAVLQISELGVDFYAELDGRMTSIVGVTVDAGLPAQLSLEDGVIDLAIGLEQERIAVVATGNELAPQTSERLEEGLGNLLVTALGSALGGLTEDLRFGVPSFEGLGLTELSLAPAGQDGEWGVARASVGEVEDTGEGCDGEGCSSMGAAGLGWVVLLPWLLRRRR